MWKILIKARVQYCIQRKINEVQYYKEKKKIKQIHWNKVIKFKSSFVIKEYIAGLYVFVINLKKYLHSKRIIEYNIN